MQVQREEYLQKLLEWKDEQVIKVITGIRRCGKSTLLKQYQDLLQQSGVEKEQIISVNFEDLDFEELQDYKKLYSWLNERLVADKTNYIFLDEIQNVPDFEKAVDSLYTKPNADIYITGSNAYLLSGDLATLLSGRYIEIRMLPFSLKEFLKMSGQDPQAGLAEYLQFGGLPYIAAMERTLEKADVYLEGIYNTVIVRDIEDRQIRKERDPSKRKITDIVLLKTIAQYLSSVIGSPVSIRKIAGYLVSKGRKISIGTVSDYVRVLTESFLFYPAERFDIAGKQLLDASRKYYMVDLGIRRHILPRSSYDLGFSIENIVFFELLRRGYTVYTGRYGQTEVDFVALKQGVYTYIQVSADISAQETFEREMRPLKLIKDNYEKIILTLDRLSTGNYSGIQVIHLLDWLLEEQR